MAATVILQTTLGYFAAELGGHTGAHSCKQAHGQRCGTSFLLDYFCSQALPAKELESDFVFCSEESLRLDCINIAPCQISSVSAFTSQCCCCHTCVLVVGETIL